MSMICYEQGPHRVKILKQELAESKNGNPQIVFTIHPLAAYKNGEELDDVPAPKPGYEPRIFLTLTDATVDWVIPTLRYIGWQGTDFNELDPANPSHHSFVDVQCDATCVYSEYNGKQSEKWNFNRGAKQLQPVEQKKLRELNARFAKALKSNAEFNVGQKPAPATNNTPATVTAPPHDEDIPF